MWEGVPDDLDEAMLYPNGVTYFLKGLKYWKFNDGKLRVPHLNLNFIHCIIAIIKVSWTWNGEKYFQVEAGYPMASAINWFGCKGEP